MRENNMEETKTGQCALRILRTQVCICISKEGMFPAMHGVQHAFTLNESSRLPGHC